MEFFINKNSTLPKLKMELVNDDLKEKIKPDKIVNIKKNDETDEDIIDKYTTEIFDVLKNFINYIVYKIS